MSHIDVPELDDEAYQRILDRARAIRRRQRLVRTAGVGAICALLLVGAVGLAAVQGDDGPGFVDTTAVPTPDAPDRFSTVIVQSLQERVEVQCVDGTYVVSITLENTHDRPVEITRLGVETDAGFVSMLDPTALDPGDTLVGTAAIPGSTPEAWLMLETENSGGGMGLNWVDGSCR